MVTSTSFDNTKPIGDGSSSQARPCAAIGTLMNSTPFSSEMRDEDSTSLRSSRDGIRNPESTSTMDRSSGVGSMRSSHETLLAAFPSACGEAGWAVSMSVSPRCLRPTLAYGGAGASNVAALHTSYLRGRPACLRNVGCGDGSGEAEPADRRALPWIVRASRDKTGHDIARRLGFRLLRGDGRRAARPPSGL